ncbi:MAG: sigma-54 dependent transcriptional regulator [Phycisphaerales bacterium]
MTQTAIERANLRASSRTGRVLVVDDDPIVADAIARFIEELGHEATHRTSARAVLDTLAHAHDPDHDEPPIDVVVSDVSMPDMNGLELLEQVRERYPSVVMVMLTGYGTIETAVEAIRTGAFDYIAKPVVDDEFAMTLERALGQRALLVENTDLRERLASRSPLKNLIAADERMLRAFEMVRAVAPSKATVLMTGESGTGKSLIARAIHELSPRAGNPFVEIHCGSIPESLLESELFGHVKGAFTGADHDKQGRFLVAHTGTIFIDEINSASPAMQLKLLRVLQERAFEPVGSNQTQQVDVRVVLAANQPLEDLVAKGEFREDLYYRINVVNIQLPPLRERPADIEPLVGHLVEHFNREHGRRLAGLTPDAMHALKRYQMPGNVRELSNIIERAVVLAQGERIDVSDLPPHVRSDDADNPILRLKGEDDDPAPAPASYTGGSLADALREPERRIIVEALRANHWNRQQTADALDINRTTLYKKMKALGIDEPH